MFSCQAWMTFIGLLSYQSPLTWVCVCRSYVDIVTKNRLKLSDGSDGSVGYNNCQMVCTTGTCSIVMVQTQCRNFNPWLAEVSCHGLDFLKSENSAKHRRRSLLSSQTVWFKIWINIAYPSFKRQRSSPLAKERAEQVLRIETGAGVKD